MSDTMMGAIDHEVVLREPQSVLEKQLGPGLELIDFTAESFLKHGDNYGSTILNVRARVRRRADETDRVDTLDLIAKMLPPSDAQRIMFETSWSFVKEIFIYESLIPTLRGLYHGHFDVTPAFYGSRLSMVAGSANEEVVDDDAVILMENLMVAGYYMENRKRGLDLESLKMTITSLAQFHAIGLSIKHKKPSYLPTLKKYMKPMNTFSEMMNPYIAKVCELVKSHPSLSRYYDKCEKICKFTRIGSGYSNVLDVEDPWACVAHADLWTNNVLFRKNGPGSSDNGHVKFIDFQLSYVSSPLTDLVFFLCISMERSLLHIDEMLELYRTRMIEYLGQLGCEARQFSKTEFDERLRIDANNEFYHVLVMVKVVELNDNESVQSEGFNDDCIVRFKNILQLFDDKGWF